MADGQAGAGDRARARVFGTVAEEYERIRPDYPTQLVDDVLAYANVDHGTALEVGAGTGKATVAFASRGVPVTALEPDPQMAAVLARRVGDRVGVQVRLAAFEDVDGTGRFGLLYSAQAWHWTDPGTRWARAAAMLRPGGAIALFWNHEEPADGAHGAAVRELKASIAPEMAGSAGQVRLPSEPGGLEWPATDLVRCPEFGDLTERRYQWRRNLPAADCAALLNTHSEYRILDDATRRRLLDAITAALPEYVELAVQTMLYLARRLPD